MCVVAVVVVDIGTFIYIESITRKVKCSLNDRHVNGGIRKVDTYQ